MCVRAWAPSMHARGQDPHALPPQPPLRTQVGRPSATHVTCEPGSVSGFAYSTSGRSWYLRGDRGRGAVRAGWGWGAGLCHADSMQKESRVAHLSRKDRSLRVPLRIALTEYSAMLRSGRAATLGREGMPAGRGGGRVRGAGAALERTRRGPGPPAAQGTQGAQALARAHTPAPTHPQTPAAAPQQGPRPRPAGSSSAQGRRPCGS